MKIKLQFVRKKLPDLNSACVEVLMLVPVKIFQFQDMHSENHFLGTISGHNVRTTCFSNVQASLPDVKCIIMSPLYLVKLQYFQILLTRVVHCDLGNI